MPSTGYLWDDEDGPWLVTPSSCVQNTAAL